MALIRGPETIQAKVDCLLSTLDVSSALANASMPCECLAMNYVCMYVGTLDKSQLQKAAECTVGIRMPGGRVYFWKVRL